MTKQEIREFIEIMEEIGDVWTEDQVEDVYGNMSLEEAVRDRKASLGTFFDIIDKVINH